ncbi:hypothetical protein [[Limnothrix rosea] IAM M-220]|uniref:hypothetical protein n=1 Tax=[Limnothrix rosea] IAM M-220 TaxID=454133 RepID=UPI00095AC8DB|nr:hypothetical protein [[Limnothrix rosea] IAM M-220]OKH17068.1 hypothetical protein NIES208_10760 [[Limnothrix rosea] IAM M-220]
MTTATQIFEMLQGLLTPALEELKSFIVTLQKRYPVITLEKPSEGMAYIEQVRGQMQCDMTTDEIMALTRGEE